MPPCDDVYRHLIPHLLNNKLYYQIEGTNNFIPADIVTPKPTADDIVKTISSDHNAVTVAEDKVLELLRSEPATHIMTDVYYQTKSEENEPDDDDDLSDTKPAPIPPKLPETVMPYFTTPTKVPTAIISVPTATVPTDTTDKPSSTKKKGRRSITIRSEVLEFVARVDYPDIPMNKPKTIRQNAVRKLISKFPIGDPQREVILNKWHKRNHERVVRNNVNPYLASFIAVAKMECHLDDKYRFNTSEQLYLEAHALHFHWVRARYTYKHNGVLLRLEQLEKQLELHDVDAQTAYKVREVSKAIKQKSACSLIV